MVNLLSQRSTYATPAKSVQSDGQTKSSEGLYNDQINKVMERYKDFKGTIMRNEIKKILPDIQPHSRVCFVINTDPSTKEGKHWVSIYIWIRV